MVGVGGWRFRFEMPKAVAAFFGAEGRDLSSLKAVGKGTLQQAMTATTDFSSMHGPLCPMPELPAGLKVGWRRWGGAEQPPHSLNCDFRTNIRTKTPVARPKRSCIRRRTKLNRYPDHEATSARYIQDVDYLLKANNPCRPFRARQIRAASPRRWVCICCDNILFSRLNHMHLILVLFIGRGIGERQNVPPFLCIATYEGTLTLRATRPQVTITIDGQCSQGMPSTRSLKPGI